MALSDIIRIECGYNHAMCIDINHDLHVFGLNIFGELRLCDSNTRYKPIKHSSLSNIIDISKGGNQTFVKTSNNEIHTFGGKSILNLDKTIILPIIGERNIGDYFQLTPIRVFEGKEDIWYSNINKSKAKSARSILPRPNEEDDNSPPKKKQKIK